ncbi:MAG TPA: DUF4365 domain-containing protein [Actinocrinis sp.]|uniref:DUF4365 domain-containing protein n=1 Tax=Actinocrinis sp. TaxID=1920516 RepID=UPI002DDD4A9F|nr:DUF4365 domain-containing protein [Actinocrinis sp.]HEV2347054.1 DUF4365 domain-containing protein [Actinocrinis sp.]
MAEALQGVMLVGAEIKGWHWSFRNQPDDDFGVDCHAEAPGADYASGRLVGLQVKTGKAKYFKVRAKDGSGWYYRPDTKPGKPDKHLRYWLEHDLPLVVILVDETTREMYWVEITLDRVIFTGGSWKILVPATQRLDAGAREAFLELALRPRAAVPDVLATATRSLPPSTARLLRSLQQVDHFKALQLAVTLSRAHEDPSGTVQTLLSGDRKFLRGKDAGKLSAALGAYAAEHRCHALAAQAFEDAATRNAEPARFLVLAAQSLVGAGEKEAARRAIAAAEEAGASALLCLWIRLFADHEGFGHPQVPAQLLDESVSEAEAEPVLRSFLGDAALAVGNLESAAEHFETALAVEPDSTGLQLALAQVLLNGVAGDRSLRPSADLRRVIELCTTARAQRLDWHGPSEEPLAALLRAHMLAGDFQEAVRLSTPRPDGDATTREASGGLVAYLGIKAALDLRDRDAAVRIASAVGPASQYADAIRLMLDDAVNPAAAQGEWQRIADMAQDLDLVASAIHKLASSGQWPLRRLEELRLSGAMTADGYEMIRARSEAARGELAAARRRLRALSTPMAVQTHVELLEAAGSLDEALEVCTKGLTDFKTVHLAAKQWNLLISLDRAQEAERRAVQMLGQTGMSPMVRAMLRAFVIGAAMQRHEWLTVEEQCHAALDEDPEEARFQWTLIGAAYNQRQWNTAWARLRELNPTIVSPNHASLWVGLHAFFGFSEDEMRAALGFIERWPERYELHAQVIGTLLSCGNKVNADGKFILPTESEDLVQLFQAALQQFLDRGSDGLHAFTGSLEELLDSTRSRLLGQAPVDLFVQEMVRQGATPVQAVCAAQRRSYTRSLMERSFGPINAVTSALGEFDREVQEASAALDGTVVIETSALIVAAELRDRWPRLRGAFTDCVIDDDVRFDCLTTCANIRQAPDTVAYLSVDFHRRELLYTQRSQGELSRLAVRANNLEAFLASLGSHAHAIEPSPDTAQQPWGRAVQTATARGAALWCDDVALRAYARTMGCPTFGTVALLHALADAGQIDGDLRQDVLQLVRAEVVDLPMDLDEFVQLSSESEGYPGPLAATLQRPHYWRHYGEAIEHFLGTLGSLKQPSPHAVTAWVAAACGGISHHLVTENLSHGLQTFAETVADRLADGEEYRESLLEVATHLAAVEQTRREAITVGQASLLASRQGTDEADSAQADSGESAAA